MPTIQIPLTMFAVSSFKPSQRFGAPANMPIATTDYGYMVGSLAAIPRSAVVSLANVVIFSARTEATHTFAIRKTTGVKSDMTWATKPATDAGSQLTLARTSPTINSAWTFPDVSAWVQAGMAAGRGFQAALLSASATRYWVRGSTSSTAKPYLEVTYSAPAERPTSLNPNVGAVSIAKPVLTFDADPDTTFIKVQIDATNTFGSPDFDSGWVASEVGMLNLATTAYAGLSNGSTTYWRCQVRNPTGVSPWSGVATFERINKDTLTITSPTTTPDDLTPELGWTFGGTQTAWQAWLTLPPVEGDAFRARPRVVAASGRVAGTDSTWNPGIELDDADEATFSLRVWDDEDRDATPGDPEYVAANLDLVVTMVDGASPVDTPIVVTTPDEWDPTVRITGTRAAGVPDEFVLYRRTMPDGPWKVVKREDGGDAWAGSAFTLYDTTAPMNTIVRYAVRCIDSGDTSAKVASSDFTPRIDGYWIFRTGTAEKVVIWGDERIEQDQLEVAIVHQPIPRDDGSPVPAIRRRLARLLTNGKISGLLLDTEGCTLTADECLATLQVWSELDSSTRYRVMYGHRSLPAVIGNIRLEETEPTLSRQRRVRVSLDFWEQD